jgi:hypothetical protein
MKSEGLCLFVQELGMGGGLQNIYSSESHQDPGGVAPP